MKLLRALLFLLVPLAFVGGHAYADAGKTITVTDDQGRQVEIPFPVKRAVVINSYAIELLRAVGADDRIVGQDKASVGRLPYVPLNNAADVSEAVDKATNIEAVVALRPDVFITARNGDWQTDIDALKPFGIPVVVLTAWDTTKLHFNAELAGQIFGTQDKAKTLEDFYDGIAQVIAKHTAGVTRKRSIYYENGTDFVSPVPGSGFHDLITEAGGINLFGDIVFGQNGNTQGTVHATPINPEDLLRRNPDLVIRETTLSYDGSDPAALKKVGDEIISRPGWSDVSAVKDGKVYVVNGYPTNTLSKQIGALYASVWLYPELYTDLDPDDYLKRWLVEFQRTKYPGPGRYIYNAVTGK